MFLAKVVEVGGPFPHRSQADRIRARIMAIRIKNLFIFFLLIWSWSGILDKSSLD
jgi:hypothetical protein